MRTDFMASAKQIAWRKKFAKLYGKKKKGGKKTKGGTHETQKSLRYKGYIGKKRMADIAKKGKNHAYVDSDTSSGKEVFYVLTFRKNASPQWFKHRNMTKAEAIKYADGFNYQNR